MSTSKSKSQIPKLFSFRRIVWPSIIGLAVVLYLLYQSFNPEALKQITWNFNLSFWVFMGFVMMVIRQVAYMYRIRILTDNKLSWGKAFDVIMLWEFASAATPSIVGGSIAALFILNKENISMGRSTAIVLCTTFLDQMFFIIFAPLFFLLADSGIIFPKEEACLSGLNILFWGTDKALVIAFIIGYTGFLIYTLAIAYGLFINPRGLEKLIVKLFSIRLLRKWKQGAIKAGEDVFIASKELQSQSVSFWWKTSIATILSWSARYFVVNCILIAFMVALDTGDHFIIYARQFVMWIILLIPTTPGSTGVAEITFLKVLCEFIPSGLDTLLVLLWRMLSYYPYLILGLILLPRWLRRVYKVSSPKSQVSS